MACLAGGKQSCEDFVSTFRKLIPEYDCQREFDRTPTKNYIVPAIWLAGDIELENHVRVLASLKLERARRLFGSPEFRKILDGYLAGEFLEVSETIQRQSERRSKLK